MYVITSCETIIEHIDANENIQCSEKTMEEITFEDLNAAMDRLDDAKTVREVLIP